MIKVSLQDFLPKVRDKVKTVNKIPLFVSTILLIIFFISVFYNLKSKGLNNDYKNKSPLKERVFEEILPASSTNIEVLKNVVKENGKYENILVNPKIESSTFENKTDPIKEYFQDAEFDLLKAEMEREKKAHLAKTTVDINLSAFKVKEEPPIHKQEVREDKSSENYDKKHKRVYPESKFEIRLGTIIPAVLETGISSQLPGMIKAIVSDNVYNSASGNYLLIPKGSHLIGTYTSDISSGQSRVMVAWNRINFPDSSYMDVNRMTGADLAGFSGLGDRVDNHYFRIFSNAALLSLISAGVSMTVPDSNKDSTESKFRESLTYSLGQNLGQTASDILRKQMNVQPTLKIRSGFEFLVMVNEDIVFDGPYKE